MIPIPDDLQHLIEKRKAAADRRRHERRDEDADALDSAATGEAIEEDPARNRRQQERRYGKDRRGALG